MVNIANIPEQLKQSKMGDLEVKSIVLEFSFAFFVFLHFCPCPGTRQVERTYSFPVVYVIKRFWEEI